jgi:small subunit ribosomal protein S17
MEQRNTRAVLEGIVISDKMDKTIVVLVETYKRHPKYAKRVKYGKKYYAHDENNVAKVGDKVSIMATRKLSATKSWRLVEVLSLAEQSIAEYQEALAEAKEA